MKVKKQIAPSILSANFAHLETDIQMVESAGAGLLHVDVMDGHFVPNITIGPLVVAAIRPITKLPLDVHLMIEHPENYVEAFAKAGAAYLTVHVEACTHLHRVLQAIRDLGVKAGVALNPHTPLNSISEVLDMLDLILIMSVNPGFGGQVFIPQTINRLKRIKDLIEKSGHPQIAIEVDGGVKLNNIKEISIAGADYLVSGSGIFNTPNPTDTIHQMNGLISVT